MKLRTFLTIGFLLWPMGIFIGLAIYNLPWTLTCFSPNATFYKALNCDAYNRTSWQLIPEGAALAFLQFGWVYLFHGVWKEDDRPS